MIDEIVIIGRPGLVGGADTELFDQIKVWLNMGLKCRVIPTSEAKYPINFSHPNLVIEEIKRYSACSGKHVISFCNQNFLADIDTIRKYAKTISWASCMCFNFNKEIEAHRKGLIDFFLYQTKHQYLQCGANLIKVNEKDFRPVPIIPYFDTTSFPFIDNRDSVSFGRISRAGIDKYTYSQFAIYRLSQVKGIKSVILGWSDELDRQFSNDFDYKYLRDHKLVDFYKPNEISAQEFYKRCCILCMTTDTFENLPRVGFEAMASGSVLVVDNRGGWKLQVESGKTGYLCNNEYDFIIALDQLLKNPELRLQLAKNARAKLEAEYSMKASASRWENFFKILT